MPNEIQPVKTRKLKPAPQQQPGEPVPTVEERLDMLSAALETVLDPEATDQAKVDALESIRADRQTRER